MEQNPQRRCRYCDQAMPALSRPQAKYCCDSHRVLACRQRQARRARLKTASRSIEGCAPKAAAFYRLILKIEGRGLARRFGPFELDPFEPPRVPVMGVYEVE